MTMCAVHAVTLEWYRCSFERRPWRNFRTRTENCRRSCIKLGLMTEGGSGKTGN